MTGALRPSHRSHRRSVDRLGMYDGRQFARPRLLRMPHIFSFSPARMSHQFIGNAVTYPQIMPICIMSQ